MIIELFKKNDFEKVEVVFLENELLTDFIESSIIF